MTRSSDGVKGSADLDRNKSLVSQEAPVSTIPRVATKNSPSWAGAIVLMTVFSVFCSVTSIAVYDRFFAQKIVTANISRFVLDQRDLYFQGRIDKEQYVNSLTRFIELLKRQPKNRVIILEDVVAANAEKLEQR